MVTGVETTATVIQFIRFVKACLDFYQEARLNTPQQHNELRLRLEVEAITFDRWCAAVGVRQMMTYATSNPKSWQKSQEFELFKFRLQEDLRFDSPLIAALVIDVLMDLGKKFDDARNRLQPSVGDSSRSTDIKSPSRWKIWSKKKVAPDSSETVQQGQIGFFGASRWMLWDKKCFTQLLDDLTGVNETLIKLLTSGRQIQVRRQINLQVLGTNGDAVLPTAQRLSIDQPSNNIVGTLAGLKEINLQENQADGKAIDKQQLQLPALKEGGRVPQYQIDDFEPETMRTGPSRVLASLNGVQLLIEWKFFSESHPLRFEQIIRLGSLVGLLNRQEIYKDFHIPRCRGLVKDDNNCRVGLIFDVPVNENTSAPQWHSLQNLISRSRAGLLPSSTDRLAIARQLSTALHHLQSVHWLHKSLRSDNVVCFQNPNYAVPLSSPANGANASLDADQGVAHENTSSQSVNVPFTASASENPPNLPAFYLLGLDLSRPDHPSELSETLSISTSAHRSSNENIELYSHPDALKKTDSGENQRYETKFDIYSLGLILLEIGLWRTLHDLRKSASKSRIDYRVQFETKYCDQLRGAMGDIYWRVTRRCLRSDFDLSDVPPGTEAGIALQLAFEKQVVFELERCTV